MPQASFSDGVSGAKLIQAAYRGICADCHASFDIDDWIKRNHDILTGGWLHADCPVLYEPKPTKFQGSSDEEMGF